MASSEDYSFSEFNASVQVYRFRPFSGNIQLMFQTTPLIDWLDPLHREENTADTRAFQSGSERFRR